MNIKVYASGCECSPRQMQLQVTPSGSIVPEKQKMRGQRGGDSGLRGFWDILRFTGCKASVLQDIYTQFANT